MSQSGGFNLLPGAPSLEGVNQSGWGPNADQQQGVGLARLAAMGKVPSAADYQMRAGIQQAQAAAGAQAASTRGSLGLAGAQRAAMGTQAGLAQQAVNQGAQMRATEQTQALGQYLSAAGQQRAQDLQASGLSIQAAQAQAQLEEQQNQSNQGMSSKLFSGLLGAASTAAMFSDERAKEEAPPSVVYVEPKPWDAATAPAVAPTPSGLPALSQRMQDVTGTSGSAFDAWLRDQQARQLAEAGWNATRGLPTPQEVPTQEQALMSRQAQAPASAQYPYGVPGGLNALQYGVGAPGDDLTASMRMMGYGGGDSMVSDERAKQEATQLGYQAGVNRAMQAVSDPKYADAFRTITSGMPPTFRTGGQMYVFGPHGYLPAEPPPNPQTNTHDVAVGISSDPARTGSAPPPPPPPPAPSMLEDAYRSIQQGVSEPPPQLAQMDAVTSDARAKQAETDHPGTQAARQFLDTLEPHAFTWRDPAAAPNPQAAQVPNLGVYAQQVEKSPWGKAIVQTDPASGLKKLDIHALVGALAAGEGAQKKIVDDHAQRLEALERFVKGGR
jgi:hypothetical protein